MNMWLVKKRDAEKVLVTKEPPAFVAVVSDDSKKQHEGTTEDFKGTFVSVKTSKTENQKA